MIISRVLISAKDTIEENFDATCELEDYRNINICNGRKLSLANGFAAVATISNVETRYSSVLADNCKDYNVLSYVTADEVSIFKQVSDNVLKTQYDKYQENYNRQKNPKLKKGNAKTDEVTSLIALPDPHSSRTTIGAFSKGNKGKALKELMYVDIDIDYITPLFYHNSNDEFSDVLEIYRIQGTSTSGFLLEIYESEYDFKFDAMITDRVTGDTNIVRIVITDDHTVHIEADVSVKHAKRKLSRMTSKDRIYPVMPALTPYAPTSLILHTKGFVQQNGEFDMEKRSEMITTVQHTLDAYPHFPFGEVNSYCDDTEYPDKFSSNEIVIAEIDGINGDIKGYTENLTARLKELTKRFRNPIRVVTIISGDKITLPREVRQKFKIRSVNRITANGVTEPLIVNRY